MPALYDNLGFNHNIALDLPFRQGLLTNPLDVSKVRHVTTMIDTGGGSFIWGNEASGIPTLQFNAVGGGAGDGVYINGTVGTTADLNFTTEDYSVGCWFKWDSTGGWSEILIGRYSTEVDGWDLYLAVSGGLNTLSQRHHHSSLGAGNLKSECFSTGWTPGVWHCMGMSRSGILTPHYRNGIPITMNYGGLTMLDPDTANRDLSIGVRGTTKAANWYRGLMWRPRVWAGRALSDEDHQNIFQIEKHWFGL